MLVIETTPWYQKKRKFRLRPVQYVLLGFTIVVLTGAFLLMLPISSNTGMWTDPLTALFTATSATCVTGLVVVDTYTHWSTFGQWTILLLIQIGGLGFMSFATLFSLMLKRTISFSERLVMMESLNFSETSGIVRTTQHILIGAFFIETIGAVILSLRFAQDFGIAEGIKMGIFHSVSAFCNAGFDIMGSYGQFSSLTHYVSDPIVNIVIMSLIVLGGLGFIVWEELVQKRTLNIKKLSPYSRLVMTVTALLLLSGFVLFAVFEWNNPDTLGALPEGERLLAAAFQSVTTRTAGFNTIDQAAMTAPSEILTIILMFIGGASGSTAGGIKVVTFAVLVLLAVSVTQGRKDIVVYGRSISTNNVLRAITIFFVALALTIGGTILMTATQPGTGAVEALFECFSAFGTVGLSLGITPTLSTISRIYIILLMFFGRVGILTVTISVAARLYGRDDVLGYPETKVLIG